MLFYKHKNSFILPPYVRVRTTMTSFGGKISPDGGILSPYVRVRIMTSLPCVRTQRHLHTQKLLTSFGGKILPDGGILSPYARVRTHVHIPIFGGENLAIWGGGVILLSNIHERVADEARIAESPIAHIRRG
jgi:hypothetical protein